MLKVRTDFSDPIWDSRLQVIWILFTGAYLISGQLFNERWFSSLFVTIAGLLIFILAWHNLITSDKGKSKNTFLVAMGGSLFILVESYKTYDDVLGSAFSLIFLIGISSVIWTREYDPSFLRFSYLLIILMLSTIIFSFVMLFATFLTKLIINISPFEGRSDIYLPSHLAGILTGIACFINSDDHLIERYANIKVKKMHIITRFFMILFFPFIAFIFTIYIDISGLINNHEIFTKLAFVGIYFFIYCLMIYITIQSMKINEVIISGCFVFVYFLIFSLSLLATEQVSASIMRTEFDHFYQYLASDFIPVVSLVIATYLTLYAFRRIVETVGGKPIHQADH